MQQMMMRGNPLEYRIPPMGGGLPQAQNSDPLGRAQGFMGQAAQSYGQMQPAKNETRTETRTAPPMSGWQMLDAGIGYGLAGMKAYDMYRQGKKPDGTTNPYLDRKDVIGAFQSPRTATPSAAAPPAAGSSAPVGGGSSAVAMGGRESKELLGGIPNDASRSTTSLNMTQGLGLAQGALSTVGSFQQGARDRKAGGKNMGGAAQSVGSGALAGASIGGWWGALGGAIVGGVSYLLG